ncbi:sugar ABC transporter substrate-binding protein [Haloferula sp. A504]|uniref:sugar ABC transporter substrate-binding protein n=1 Tax=Haloferula sp. A504 TaxID=3373601 RepID=UPI0031BED5C0|nr:sugar ABC transporter substrate-binding protein [Verrucomicrobiaceae bacterium E54]
MKRLFKTLALLGTGALLAGCDPNADDTRPVVGVSLLNLANEFIVTIEGALEEEAEAQGVRLIINDAQRDASRQIQQVENFIAQGVDAVVLNPCELEASSPAVERAQAAGIPIVNVNSETTAVPDAFVGSRDEESGRLAMAFIAEKLGGEGGVLMMHGYMGQAAQIKRDAGAREVLAQHPELKLIAAQTAEWDRAKAVTLMENWLQSYGDEVDAVFAQNDEMAMGALLAIERAGKKDDILVVGVDAIGDALQAVKDGRLDATVFQDGKGQARAALQAAIALSKGETVEKETFIPFQLVTKENVGEFLE